MHRTVTDRYLPPDHAAFVAAEPPTGRLIVIAPTRAACETIELALGFHIPTVLEKQHGAEIGELAGRARDSASSPGRAAAKPRRPRRSPKPFSAPTDTQDRGGESRA